jgi:psp operon transcriptional activator
VGQASLPEVKEPQEHELASLPLREAVKRLEISMIRQALAESRYNQKTAAARLGLSYDQLRGLLRKYGDQIAAKG